MKQPETGDGLSSLEDSGAGQSIGVLDLQGGVAEHMRMLEACGVAAVAVRVAADLADLDGLILPGGESTTICKLIVSRGLLRPLVEFAKSGRPIFGTCAGLVIMGDSLGGACVTNGLIQLGLIDVKIKRNGYGRQLDSFEADVRAGILGKEPVQAIFIRAPLVEDVGGNCEVLAKFEGKPVMVRRGPFLATAFHPELGRDPRIHKLFLDMVAQPLSVSPSRVRRR
ncbi:MAG: pyridoxal 5'-phosphate synthase glutaminase subunit PdxT [Terriglobia bacterium]